MIKPLKIKIFDNVLKNIHDIRKSAILHWYFWRKSYAEKRKIKWLKSTLRHHSEIVKSLTTTENDV